MKTDITAEDLLDGHIDWPDSWPYAEDLLDGKAAVPGALPRLLPAMPAQSATDLDSSSFRPADSRTMPSSPVWGNPQFIFPAGGPPAGRAAADGYQGPDSSSQFGDASVPATAPQDNGVGRIRSLGKSFAKSGVEGIASSLQGLARQINGVMHEQPLRTEWRGDPYTFPATIQDFMPQPSREELARTAWKDLQESALYQAGEYLRGGAEEAYQPNPKYAGTLDTHLAEMAGGLFPVMATGPAGPLIGGAQSTEEVFRTAYDAFKKAGLSDEEALDEADAIGRGAGLAAGFTYALAPGVGGKLSDLAAKRIANELAKRIIVRAVQGGTVGALDRAVQDAIAIHSYRPEMTGGEVAADIGRGTLAGGVVGAGLGGVHDVVSWAGNRLGPFRLRPEPAAPGELAESIPGSTSEPVKAPGGTPPRVVAEFQTKEGALMRLEQSGAEVTKESVLDKIESEHPGALISRIEEWTPADSAEAEAPKTGASETDGRETEPVERALAEEREDPRPESLEPDRVEAEEPAQDFDNAAEQSEKGNSKVFSLTDKIGNGASAEDLERTARALIPGVRLEIKDGPPPTYNGRYIRGTVGDENQVVFYRKAFTSLGQVKPVLLDELGHSFGMTPEGEILVGRIKQALSSQEIAAMKALGYSDDMAEEEAVNRRMVRLSNEPPSSLLRHAWDAFVDGVTRFARKKGWIGLTGSDLRDLLKGTIEHGRQGQPGRLLGSAFNLGGVEPLVEIWKTLAEPGSAFYYPREISSKSPEEVAREMSTPEKRVWAERRLDGKITFNTQNGSISLSKNGPRFIEIYAEDAGSKGKEGGGGTLLYQTAFAYAHNNGLVVQPYGGQGAPGIDPTQFISEINKLRRTSNMISSALRFGTTKHMLPSPAQGADGWSPGNHDGNLRALLNAEAKMVVKRMEWVGDLHFDAKSNEIKDQFGKVWSDGKIGNTLKEVDPGFDKGIGLATVKRALITKYLLSLKPRHGGANFKPLADGLRERMFQKPILYSLGDRAE